MDQICFGAKIKAAQLSTNKDDCGDTVNTNSTGEKVRRTYVCNKFSIHNINTNINMNNSYEHGHDFVYLDRKYFFTGIDRTISHFIRRQMHYLYNLDSNKIIVLSRRYLAKKRVFFDEPKADEYYVVKYVANCGGSRTYVGRVTSVDDEVKVTVVQFYRRRCTISGGTGERFFIRLGDVDNFVPFGALSRWLEVKESTTKYMTFVGEFDDLTE